MGNEAACSDYLRLGRGVLALLLLLFWAPPVPVHTYLALGRYPA